MLKALNLDPYRYSVKAVEKLSAWMDIDNFSNQAGLADIINRYDILLLRFSCTLNADLLRRANRLKIIACNATGIDHIDVGAAKSQGIELISLKGETEFLESIHATAELSWGLLLSAIRAIPYAHNQVVAGVWDRNQFFAHELHGKSIGILGFGRIGKKIASYANAFGMQVYAFDKQKKRFPDYVTALDSLECLCSSVNILSVHVSYDQESHGLLNEALLRLLPKAAVLINSARGAVIDEKALVKLLTNGHIRAAAVDVLVDEMQPNFLDDNVLANYAKTHNNLIITPHIGGVTYESWESTELFIAEKVIEKIHENYIGFIPEMTKNLPIINFSDHG